MVRHCQALPGPVGSAWYTMYICSVPGMLPDAMMSHRFPLLPGWLGFLVACPLGTPELIVD